MELEVLFEQFYDHSNAIDFNHTSYYYLNALTFLIIPSVDFLLACQIDGIQGLVTLHWQHNLLPLSGPNHANTITYHVHHSFSCLNQFQKL